MQQRMKHQADKHRTEREFSIGDQVLLKLQLYIQSSVALRANHKMAFKFFGPFTILEPIGLVAYKLDLPPTSRVHLIFHVSQLKPYIGTPCQVLTQLPSPDDLYQIPVRVLQRRLRQAGHRGVAQVLVQWSGADEDQATWEDLEALRQRFPLAPAWGQAGLQQRGIVSDPTPADNDDRVSPSSVGRPMRTRRAATRYSGDEWAK